MNSRKRSTFPEPETALSVRNLTLLGSDGFVLNVPTLSIESGAIVAIIGANGSGKTSLLETILGLRKTISGQVSFYGNELNNSVRNDLGVYLQSANFEESMLVGEILALNASLFNHTEDQLKAHLAVAELERKTFDQCSTGQRQRVGIYLALASKPKLSLLDEPTSGLDANAATAFRQHLAETDWQGAQRTCVIVTHTDADARLAKRVVWLDRGEVVGVGSLDYLISSHLGERHLVLSDLTNEQFASVKQLIPKDSVFRKTSNGYFHTIHVFGDNQFERDLLQKVQNEKNLNYTASQTGAEDLVLFGISEKDQ